MLGVLRCDWAELASLIGVAVTPVVGFLGNLSREQINPNPDEVRKEPPELFARTSQREGGVVVWSIFAVRTGWFWLL